MARDEAEAERWRRKCATRRAANRERMVLSLRTRRLEAVPKDGQVMRAALRGYAELDRLEQACEPMTRAEVAASLGLSREAVRLIEARALTKVRIALAALETEW